MARFSSFRMTLIWCRKRPDWSVSTACSRLLSRVSSCKSPPRSSFSNVMKRSAKKLSAPSALWGRMVRISFTQAETRPSGSSTRRLLPCQEKAKRPPARFPRAGTRIWAKMPFLSARSQQNWDSWGFSGTSGGVTPSGRRSSASSAGFASSKSRSHSPGMSPVRGTSPSSKR